MTTTEIGNWLVRSVPEAIMLCWLVTALLGIKQKPLKVILVGFLASIIYVGVPKLLPVDLGGFVIVLSFGVWLVYSMIVCKAPLLTSMKASVGAALLVFPCDLVSMSVMKYVLGIPQEVIVSRSVPVMALSTMGLLLMLVFIRMARKYHEKKATVQEQEVCEDSDLEDAWQ